MSWSRAFVRIAHNTNERVVPIEDLEAMSSVFKRYLVSDKRIQDWRNQNAQKDMQEFLQRDVVRKMIDTVDEAKFLSDGQKQELQTLLKQMIQTPAEETKNALANFLDSIVFEERAKPEEEFMKLQQTKLSLEDSSDAKSTEAKQLKDQINIYDQQFEKLEEWNGKKQELSIDIEQLTVLMAFKSEEIDRTNEKTESVQKRLEEKLQPFEQRIATTNASIEQLELEKEEYLSEFDTVECPATNSSISSFDKQLEALQMQNQKLQTTIPELKTLASGLNRFFASGIRRMFTTVTEIDNNVLLTTLETQFGYPSSVAILDLVYRFATSVVQLENKLEDNSPLLVVQALFNYLNTYYDTGMKNTRQEHLAAFDRLYSDLRVLLDDETIIPDLGTIIEMFFEEITSRYELYLAVMFDRETSIDEKSMAKTALATVENAIQQNNAEIQELYQQRYEFVRNDAVWDKVEKAKKEWKGTTLQALEDEKKRNERDLENVLRILDIAKRQRDGESINREEREILEKTKKTKGSLRTTPLTTKEVIKKLQGDVAFAEQKLANTQKKINNFDRPGGQLAVARKKYVCLLKNYDPLLFSFEEQVTALREQIVQTETEITQDQTIQAFEQEIATLNEKAKRLENELEEHNVELQKKQAGLDTLDEPDEPDVTAEELEQLKDQLLTLLEQATNLSVEADRVGQELDVIRRQLEQIDAQDQVVISVKRDIQKLYQTLLQEQQPEDKDETLVTFLTTYSPAEAAPVFDLAQNWLITLINDQVDQNEYGQYFAPTRTSQAIQEFKKYPRVRTDARSKLNKWQRKRLGFEPKTQ